MLWKKTVRNKTNTILTSMEKPFGNQAESLVQNQTRSLSLSFQSMVRGKSQQAATKLSGKPLQIMNIFFFGAKSTHETCRDRVFHTFVA